MKQKLSDMLDETRSWSSLVYRVGKPFESQALEVIEQDSESAIEMFDPEKHLIPGFSGFVNLSELTVKDIFKLGRFFELIGKKNISRLIQIPVLPAKYDRIQTGTLSGDFAYIEDGTLRYLEDLTEDDFNGYTAGNALYLNSPFLVIEHYGHPTFFLRYESMDDLHKLPDNSIPTPRREPGLEEISRHAFFMHEDLFIQVKQVFVSEDRFMEVSVMPVEPYQEDIPPYKKHLIYKYGHWDFIKFMIDEIPQAFMRSPEMIGQPEQLLKYFRLTIIEHDSGIFHHSADFSERISELKFGQLHRRRILNLEQAFDLGLPDYVEFIS